MSPAKLQSLLQSGVAHHRAGRLDDAEAAYRQVRIAAPRNFDALHLSGLVAFQQGRVNDAVALLERAHKLEPKNDVCQMRHALALLAAKRTPEAEKHLRQVVERSPRFFEGWDNLAYCLKTQDRLDEALACHARAVEIKPDFANGWYNYGLTLSLCGRSAEALECHQRALAADRNFALGHFGRAQALHQLDRIPEAVEAYGRFLEIEPQHHEARSYRLLALHNLENISREQLFAEHVAYGKRVSAGIGAPPRFANAPEPARRLRVAILSPDLRVHSCAFFLEPLLRHLDREQFELYLYHDHFREDATSARLRALAVVWRNFVGQPDSHVESVIRADAPDILIDLAGHTGMTNRLPLFARRLAPVQVTYLGYPNTTGVPAMDYRFTDPFADPPEEADAFATEKLVRFSSTAWAYAPPADAPEPGLRPCSAQGRVTFGCFNNPAKITDAMLRVWARILNEVPGSRLCLKGLALGDASAKERLHGRCRDAGIAAERVDLLERTADTRSHLALYHAVDIAFDTFPYHGTTTTCEALWMGVPVVTLAGDRHMSRVGVSLLNAIGRNDWVASSADDYARIAVALARAPEALAGASQALRGAMQASPLLDHALQAARFGGALRAIWGDWCRRAGAPPGVAFAQGSAGGGRS